MKIAVAPSIIAQRIKACNGIKTVQLWNLPFETLSYTLARQDLLASNTPEARLMQANLQTRDEPFLRPTPLSRGRRKQMRGDFAGDEEDPGAKLLFLSMRVGEDEISTNFESRTYLRQIGFLKSLPKDPETRNRTIEILKNRVRLMKTTSGYWLALSHYDSGDYESAVDWFNRIQKDPGGVTFWNHGAAYNEGRALEAQGKYADARERYYLDEESNQRHGNLLRARLLIQAEQAK